MFSDWRQGPYRVSRAKYLTDAEAAAECWHASAVDIALITARGSSEDKATAREHLYTMGRFARHPHAGDNDYE